MPAGRHPPAERAGRRSHRAAKPFVFVVRKRLWAAVNHLHWRCGILRSETMSRFLRVCAGLAMCAARVMRAGAVAQPAPEVPDITKVPAAAQPSDHFDVNAATDAYLALMPASAKARSDAYFEGGYWLTRVIGFPMAVYEGYSREWKYGLATQTFGPWMWDQVKGLLLGVVLGGVIVVLLFWVVRKLPRTWWIWGAAVTLVFVIFVIMIGPVFLQPIFNKVTRLDDARVTQPILQMARANGIPAKDVWQIDASKQTTRMSANVSGFGQTMRITMSDNLLRRGSLEEIEEVMGHEMGHYILNHIPKSMIFFLVVIVAAFAYLRWSLDWCLGRWGAKWGIRSVSDPAVLPLVVLLGSIFFFVLTPILNTEIRSQEAEADSFGINASRQPDGMAQAAIHLGEYRKMKPGPIEEWIFFDHPSGYNRIHKAMQWKAENLQLYKTQPE